MMNSVGCMKPEWLPHISGPKTQSRHHTVKPTRLSTNERPLYSTPKMFLHINRIINSLKQRKPIPTSFKNSWLQNLLIRKHTPRKGCNTCSTCSTLRGDIVARTIGSIHTQARESADHLVHNGVILWRHKKLNVGFLINSATRSTPAEHGMVRFLSINRWLGINGHKSASIHIYQNVADDTSFILQRSLAPRNYWYSTLDIRCKYVVDILGTNRRITPHGQSIFFSTINRAIEMRIGKFPKGWRSTVSPPSVRELIPCHCPLNIRLRSVGPVDRSHIFTQSFQIASRTSPGQRPPSRNGLTNTQLRKNVENTLFQVESIEMTSRDTMCEQSSTHLHTKFNPICLHCLIVAGNRSQVVPNVRRNLSSAK
jgi:hypothetical protein